MAYKFSILFWDFSCARVILDIRLGCFLTTDLQTPPLPPPHNWPSRHNIKDAQYAKENYGRKISYHIISRLGAAGVQKVRFGHPKIQVFSKVTKYAGSIGIDLTLTF